jgi:hypothetical protein
VETLEQVRDKLGPFVLELIRGESRFTFHGIGNHVFNDEKFFVVTKKTIHLPYGLPSVEHEIAHAVEMKDQKRWLLPDWGLAFKRFSKEEHLLTPRMMFVAMAREIRVRAIGLHMLSEKEQTNTQSTSYNILNNQHAWGAWARRMVPFGRFKTYQDVDAWANDLREKTFNAWCKDRIIHEWRIRLNHIQNWMETS